MAGLQEALLKYSMVRRLTDADNPMQPASPYSKHSDATTSMLPAPPPPPPPAPIAERGDADEQRLELRQRAAQLAEANTVQQAGGRTLGDDEVRDDAFALRVAPIAKALSAALVELARTRAALAEAEADWAEASTAADDAIHSRERELWRLRARGLRAEARAEAERRTRSARATEGAQMQMEQHESASPTGASRPSRGDASAGAGASGASHAAPFGVALGMPDGADSARRQRPVSAALQLVHRAVQAGDSAVAASERRTSEQENSVAHSTGTSGTEGLKAGSLISADTCGARLPVLEERIRELEDLVVRKEGEYLRAMRATRSTSAPGLATSAPGLATAALGLDMSAPGPTVYLAARPDVVQPDSARRTQAAVAMYRCSHCNKCYSGHAPSLHPSCHAFAASCLH
jgi:hypothetical protein